MSSVADKLLGVPQIEQRLRNFPIRLVFRPVPALSHELGVATDEKPAVVRLVSSSGRSPRGFDSVGRARKIRDVTNAIDITNVSGVELRLSALTLRPEVKALLPPGREWVHCRCARFAPIVVGWESRSRFVIPQRATHQAFVYGMLDGMDDAFSPESNSRRAPFRALGHPCSDSEPFERLLVGGGFVYANCDSQLAEACAGSPPFSRGLLLCPGHCGTGAARDVRRRPEGRPLLEEPRRRVQGPVPHGRARARASRPEARPPPARPPPPRPCTVMRRPP